MRATSSSCPRASRTAYCTLEPNTEVIYKVNRYYSPECDRGLLWNDPALGIDWGLAGAEPVLSAKDKTHPALADLPAYFTYA